MNNILNKRMPSKNSPTNKAGKKVATMHKEYLVVLKKVINTSEIGRTWTLIPVLSKTSTIY